MSTKLDVDSNLIRGVEDDGNLFVSSTTHNNCWAFTTVRF